MASVPHLLDPRRRTARELLDQMINRQALIIAYNDDFRMMSFVVMPALLLLLLMRRPRLPVGGGRWWWRISRGELSPNYPSRKRRVPGLSATPIATVFAGSVEGCFSITAINPAVHASSETGQPRALNSVSTG